MLINVLRENKSGLSCVVDRDKPYDLDVLKSLPSTLHLSSSALVGVGFVDTLQSLSVAASGSLSSPMAYTGTSFGAQLLTLDFQFGGKIDVSIFAHVYANSSTNYDNAGVSALGVAGANLGNAISWGGIFNLKDSRGNSITDYSALSADSGFNYAKAYVSSVPLPAAAWLLGSGLLGLVGMMRRRVA